MKASSAEALVNQWRHYLDLGPWLLKTEWVNAPTLEDGSLGECGEWRDYGATLRVALRQEDVRATVIHELLHCLSRDTVRRVFETLREDLEEPASSLTDRMWLVEEERMVRRLERLIVLLLEKQA